MISMSKSCTWMLLSGRITSSNITKQGENPPFFRKVGGSKLHTRMSQFSMMGSGGWGVMRNNIKMCLAEFYKGFNTDLNRNNWITQEHRSYKFHIPAISTLNGEGFFHFQGAKGWSKLSPKVKVRNFGKVTCDSGGTEENIKDDEKSWKNLRKDAFLFWIKCMYCMCHVFNFKIFHHDMRAVESIHMLKMNSGF